MEAYHLAVAVGNVVGAAQHRLPAPSGPHHRSAKVSGQAALAIANSSAHFGTKRKLESKSRTSPKKDPNLSSSSRRKASP